MNALIRFYREEEGVTAIEYGLLAALIALVMAVGAATLGDAAQRSVRQYRGPALTASERPTRDPSETRIV